MSCSRLKELIDTDIDADGALDVYRPSPPTRRGKRRKSETKAKTNGGDDGRKCLSPGGGGVDLRCQIPAARAHPHSTPPLTTCFLGPTHSSSRWTRSFVCRASGSATNSSLAVMNGWRGGGRGERGAEGKRYGFAIDQPIQICNARRLPFKNKRLKIIIFFSRKNTADTQKTPRRVSHESAW